MTYLYNYFRSELERTTVIKSSIFFVVVLVFYFLFLHTAYFLVSKLDENFGALFRGISLFTLVKKQKNINRNSGRFR